MTQQRHWLPRAAGRSFHPQTIQHVCSSPQLPFALVIHSPTVWTPRRSRSSAPRVSAAYWEVVLGGMCGVRKGVKPKKGEPPRELPWVLGPAGTQQEPCSETAPPRVGSWGVFSAARRSFVEGFPGHLLQGYSSCWGRWPGQRHRRWPLGDRGQECLPRVA